MDDKTLNRTRRLIRRGNFRLGANELKDALTAYEQASDLMPDSVELLTTISALKHHLGRTDEAIRHLRDILLLEENDEAKIDLGLLLLERNPEQANELFSSIDSQDSVVSAGKAISSILLNKNLVESVNLLQRATFDSQNLHRIGLQVDYYRALALHAQGNHSAAAQALRATERDWQISHTLGVQYFGMGAMDTARRNFSEAISKYEFEAEQNEHVKKKLEFDYINSIENNPERKSLLENFIETYGTSFESNYALAVCYVEGGGYENEEILDILTKTLDLAQKEEDKEILKQWIDHIRGDSEQ